MSVKISDETMRAVTAWLVHRDMSRAGDVLDAMQGWIRIRAAHYHRVMSNRGVEWDDVYQEACMAVLHALSKFDPENGAGFATYSDFWISAYLQHFLRRFGTVLRVPNSATWQHICTNYDRWMSEINPSGQRANVYNAHVQISTSQNVQVWQLDVFYQMRLRPRSTDPLPGEQEKYGGVPLFDPVDYERLCCDKLHLERVHETLKHQFCDARPVVRDILYSRIVSQYPAPLESIGRRNGLTRERIRQIEADVKRTIEEIFNLPEDSL